MVRIIKGKVKTGATEHRAGDVIEGLSEKEEARLIELKVAEEATAKEVTQKEVAESAQDGSGEDPYRDMNVEEMEEVIEGMDTVSELEKLLEYERQNKDRKTVVSAIKEKLEEVDALEESEDDAVDFDPGETIK